MPRSELSVTGYNLINATITRAVNANALTIALKTIAGADPSPTDPAYIGFRNSDVTIGDASQRIIAAAVSLTVPSGAELGFANGVPGRLWLGLFDVGDGTVKIGVKKCSTSTQIFPLAEFGVDSTTAIGTGSDNAGVWYTDTALTSCPFRVIGTLDWDVNPLATAGLWAAVSDKVNLFSPGSKKPGDVIQVIDNVSAARTSGTGVIPYDDTVPQNTEGDQFFSTAITPTSKINHLLNEFLLRATNDSFIQLAASLFQDSTANALLTSWSVGQTVNTPHYLAGEYRMIANTTSQTTFKVRAGQHTAGGTTWLNGDSGGRVFGGTLQSHHKITEIVG